MNDLPADQRLLRRIEWTNAVLLVITAVAAWLLFSAKMAFSVFLGGVIVTLSFQVLKWQLKKAFGNPGKVPSKGGLFASYYVRFIGTLFLVFVVMYNGWADPIAFAVGLSVVVLSIVLVGGFESLVMLAKKGES